MAIVPLGTDRRPGPPVIWKYPSTVGISPDRLLSQEREQVHRSLPRIRGSNPSAMWVFDLLTPGECDYWNTLCAFLPRQGASVKSHQCIRLSGPRQGPQTDEAQKGRQHCTATSPVKGRQHFTATSPVDLFGMDVASSELGVFCSVGPPSKYSSRIRSVRAPPWCCRIALAAWAQSPKRWITARKPDHHPPVSKTRLANCEQDSPPVLTRYAQA